MVLDNLTFYPSCILIEPLTEIVIHTKPSSKEVAHAWIEEMRHGAKEGRSRLNYVGDVVVLVSKTSVSYKC